MLVSGGNLDLLALLDGQEIPAEMQELLDALNAILSGAGDVSDEETLSTVIAEIELLFASTDEVVVDNLLTRLEAAIGASAKETKGSPTQPSSTPAAAVIAIVPAEPRPFLTEAPVTAPPAPAGLAGKDPGPAPPVDHGAQTTAAVAAGDSGDKVLVTVPVMNRTTKAGADGDKPPPATASRLPIESLPATDRAAAAVVISPASTGETPTAASGVLVVPADSTVTDRPVRAAVGMPVADADPTVADTRSSTPGFTLKAVPPAATVEITAGKGETASPFSVTAPVSNDAPMAAMAAPAAAASAVSGTLIVDGVADTNGRPDVAEQIVRQARVTIAQGGGTATLQLRPPELGKLDLKISVGKDGVVSMHVISHNQEARFLVHSQLTDLQSSLQNQGFELGEFSVSVRDQRESTGREADGQSGGTSDDSEDPGAIALEFANEAVPRLAWAGYGTLDFSA